MNRLFSIPLNDTEPLEPQINTMINTSHHLTKARFSFTNQQIAHTITNALPMSHRMLKIILNNLSPLDQTAKNIKLRIFTDEDSRIHESRDRAAAFYAKAAKKGKDGKKKLEKKDSNKDKGKGNRNKCKDQQKKCYTYCNYMGHDISEC
jgi:hypothetical protein